MCSMRFERLARDGFSSFSLDECYPQKNFGSVWHYADIIMGSSEFCIIGCLVGIFKRLLVAVLEEYLS